MLKTAACLSLCATLLAQQPASPSLGLFESHADIGPVLHEGSAQYDPLSKTYTLAGSGVNMWATNDEFHFVWKKVSGRDLTLAADIALLGTEGDHHRKAALMIRQTLDSDSAYVDAAVHGDGLTSLQFRSEKGAATHEIESNVSAPRRLRLTKRGDLFYLSIGSSAQDLQFAGGSTRLTLQEPFYVGIGVCAHNKDNIQKAAFTNVDLDTRNVTAAPVDYSTLETISVTSTDARVTLVAPEDLTAPSWASDGKSLTFRSGVNSKQVVITGGTPSSATPEDQPITPPVNTAHAGARLSPDGKQIAYLTSPGNREEVSLIIESTGPDKATKTIATFTGNQDSLGSHPWSPDSHRIAFISYQHIY